MTCWMWPMSSTPASSSPRSLRAPPRRWRSHAYLLAIDRQQRVRQAYERWIADMIGRHDEWTAYLMTFMFNALPGSTESRLRQMAREIEHFYTTLITRVTRRPNQ